MVSAEDLAAVERVTTQVHGKRASDGAWEVSLRTDSGRCVTCRGYASMYDSLVACADRILNGEDDYRDRGPEGIA